MRIAVGAITRRRSDKLADLLGSFVRMEIPERTEIKFFIVENDESKASRDVVDGFRTSVAAPVRYDLETEPGIPFARNAVLDAALEEGMDYLTFVDDDETVQIDWLREMITGMKAHGLDLGGGPSFAQLTCSP
ncbi:MAG: glycosyltransferase family 2 protein [Rhodobacteraceae bacterium]|nr:glycosyltransferase family 2 protein [Paracoccaceae bacterium]